MKKVISKIAKIIIISIVICILSSSSVSALTSAELGQYIAQYGIDYAEHYSEVVSYSVTAQNLRPKCYRLQAFVMDCSGFATLVWLNSNDVQLHRAEMSNSGTWTICDGYWRGSLAATSWNDIFYIVEDGSMQPGDLVMMSKTGNGIQDCSHVGIYAYYGQPVVVHCANGVQISPLDGKKLTDSRYVIELTLRVKEEVAANANGKQFVPGSSAITGNPTIGETIENLLEWKYKYVKIPFRPQEDSSIDKDKTFEYQGITKAESVTEENITNEDEWRFPVVSDLIEWILNFMVTTVKSILVGFGTLVQVLVSYYIDAASGEDVSNRMQNGMMAYFTEGGLMEDVKKSITLEKIFYNKVPLFDVDVFNGNVAGGQTVDSSSLIVIVRNTVAGLYMAVRTLSLIGLLLALIYFGIKFVITGIAEEKAEYKQKLLNWGIAFFIVFGIHYFLIAVMKMNEIVVNLVSGIGANIVSEVSGGQYFDLAQAMRELTYQTGVVKSILSTFLYLAMVYYLVKFVIIYFKRLFVTILLILLAPLIGIKYALDKLKFKESSTLVTWAKEYIFSVGTQSIHALVYTIFIGITYSMVLNIDSAKMAVCILAFMFFRFMTEAEKMLRNFLKLAGGSTSSNIMGDANSTDIKDLVGWAVLHKIYGYADETPIKSYVKSRYKTGKKFMKHQFENEYVKMKRNQYIDQYIEAYRPNARGEGVPVLSNIDKQIEIALKKEFNRKVDKAVNNISSSWDVAHNAGRIVIGIPIGVAENTLLGTGLVATGGYTLIKSLGGAITGYKSTSTIKKYRAKDGTYIHINKWADQNATYKVAHELRRQYLYEKDDELAVSKERMFILHRAREAEVNMQYEIAKQKEGLLKGADGGDSTTKIQNELARTYTRQLRRQVEDLMKTVDRKDIQMAVQDYMKRNNKQTLLMDDFLQIAEELDLIQIEGKDLDAYLDMAGLTENIKNETMALFISDVIKVDGFGENSSVTMEVINQVQDNIQEKLSTTTDEKERKTLQNAMKCVDDRKHQLNGEETQKVYSNLSPEEQQKVRGVLEEAARGNGMEEKMQQMREQFGNSQEMTDYVKKLDSNQVVDLIKKAVDKDGSIIKEHPVVDIPEFKPILEQAQKMKELNELAKEIGEEPVYKDVGRLVERMIKSVDIRLDNESTNLNIRPNQVNDQNRDSIRRRLDEIRNRTEQ